MKVSVVIPAYNEEKTIAGVLKPLINVKAVSEVIVVSDGSTDNTAEIAKNYGAKVIKLTSNVGKGGAMMVGVKAAESPVIMFLDADLLGLTAKHVEDLINPVLYEGFDMSVGLFEHGRLATDLAQIVAPFLSGQRVLKKELLQEMSDLDASRFGIEVALTKYAREKKLPVKEIHLKDMTHVMKEEKFGFIKGFVARMKMYWDIARYVSKDVKTGTRD
ncbi:MAG: hypothetical protein PWQ96_586 [Clostridia bacterium]|jgi:glycosyltransferase involved in cell wall biosynthesis|nr:hypothetical protein [Clostridia bacterium]